MSPAQIADALRDLSERMVTIGAAMDYHGGFDAFMVSHGRELVGAGYVARDWANEIEATLAGTAAAAGDWSTE